MMHDDTGLNCASLMTGSFSETADLNTQYILTKRVNARTRISFILTPAPFVVDDAV